MNYKHLQKLIQNTIRVKKDTDTDNKTGFKNQNFIVLAKTDMKNLDLLLPIIFNEENTLIYGFNWLRLVLEII